MKGSRARLALIGGYVMLAALAAPGVLFAADGGSDAASTSSGAVVAPSPGDPDQSVSSSAVSSGKQTAHEVVMKDIEFVPKQINVDVGDTVTWRNEDSVDHNAIADDDSFASGNFGQGETFSATISEAGTIPYICSLHAGMKGTIVAGGGDTGGGGGTGSGDGSGGGTDSGTGAGKATDDVLTPTSPSSGTSPTASGGSSSLPTTGSDAIWLAIAGAWLLIVGAAVRVALSGAR